MLKNVQRHVILWIQARIGVTPTFVAGIALSIASVITAFVFLCVSGYMWATSKIGPVFGGLAMAGIFLVLAAFAFGISDVSRRRMQRAALLERARTAKSAFDPKMLQIALRAGRSFGWHRAVPLLLLGFLGVQWVQEARKPNIRKPAGSSSWL
jgi:hypothetical protein